MIVHRRDELPNDSPPSPFSYFLPLLLVVLGCGGFLWYRRKERHEHNFSLRDIAARSRLAKLAGVGGAVRLSTDGMPPTHEFLSNNASTDSLPTGVELPHLSNTSPITAQSLSTPPKPQPVASLSEKSKIVPASPARRFLRRSRRQEGPVEPDDDELSSADDTEDSTEDLVDTKGPGKDGKAAEELAEPLFGIGDEPEPDSPTLSPGKPR